MKIGPVIRSGHRVEKTGTGQSKRSLKTVVLHLFVEKPPMNRLKQKFTRWWGFPT